MYNLAAGGGAVGVSGSNLTWVVVVAVIAGLADDVKISRTAAGLSIRMSWPSGDYTG